MSNYKTLYEDLLIKCKYRDTNFKPNIEIHEVKESDYYELLERYEHLILRPIVKLLSIL
jgi:hypothetical protein